MRRPPLLRGLLFPALVAALAVAPAGADPWYQHYDLAEKALAAEDWTAAVEQLNEAIARKGDSGARVRTYGMKFTDYFHYLKLGIGGPRNWIWLLGTRRVGKTSLLKQLEHLTAEGGQGFFPLFWDFQGADDRQGLTLDFHDALLDAEERLDGLGIAVSDLDGDDLFASLGRLRRRLRTLDRTLLLLCDEAEELIQLRDKDPALLRRRGVGKPYPLGHSPRVRPLLGMETGRMNDSMDASPEAFRLADWQVLPRLNLLVRERSEVRLEPRVMDLLVYFARHAGEVVSKDEIIGAVWQGQFISDSALTRAVADLRKSLGDDARRPRFISTITKRGYRLIAPVTWAEPGEHLPGTERRTLAVGHAFALSWRQRTLPLGEGEHLIGREPEGAVSISSRKVSRRHARIVVGPDAARLEDLESKNGTYLNGRRIAEAVELTDGDEIAVGPAKLIFRALVPAGSTETELRRTSGNQPTR